MDAAKSERAADRQRFDAASSVSDRVYVRLFASQRRLLCGMLAVAVLFGAIVEMRAAFLTRRMGDLPIFLRGAWAVASGAELYAVTDHNGWHYHYPPLLALLLTPAAEPPPDVGAPRMPYPLVVGLWYLLSLLALAFGVHVLAGALESAVPDTAAPRGSPGWWSLRLTPVLICLPAVGGTLARGQVNLIVLACLCAMIAAALRARRVRAGLWLSLATCLKVLPAVILLHAVVARDRRWLAGAAGGALACLLLLPALSIGPSRTLALSDQWARAVVLPALGLGADDTRSDELLAMTNNDNQSIMAAAHNFLLRDTPRAARPARPLLAARVLHWLAALLCIAVTVACARSSLAPLREALVLGLWCVAMVLVSPAAHLHYFVFAVPLWMALLVAMRQERGVALQRVVSALAVSYPIALLLPHIPGLEGLRHGGLAIAATIALWGVGVWTVRTRDKRG